MVCEVCSVDRTEDGDELVILDYPRYLAAESPCLNCGSGAPREKPAALRNIARQVIERRKVSHVGP